MKTEMYSVVHYSQSYFVSSSLRLAKKFAREHQHPLVIRFEFDPSPNLDHYRCTAVFHFSRRSHHFVEYTLDEYRDMLSRHIIYDF